MPGKKHFDFPYVGNAAETSALFVSTGTAGPSNTTTATSLFGSGVGTMNLPAGFLSPGVAIEIVQLGYYNTVTGSPGTITINLLANTTLNLQTTGAITLTSGISNLAFRLLQHITCYQSGSGTNGVVWTQGQMDIFTTSSNQVTYQMGPPQLLDNIDTTIPQLIDVQAQFSVANVNNFFICTNSIVKFFN